MKRAASASRGVPRLSNCGSRVRRPLVAAVIAICLSVGILSPASAAPAAAPTSRVTFGILPATAGGRAVRSNFTIGATPGGVVFDHVAVVNYSAVPLTLQVYATDAIETSAGGFGLLPANVTPTATGSWIEIPAQYATVVVPAKTSAGPGQVLVPLTIRVPFKTSPGDHVAGIVTSLQTRGTNATGQVVVLDQRVGTRVYIQVSGPLVSKLTISGLHSSYVGTLNPVGRGHVETRYVLTNSGNTDLAVKQTVAVTGLLGSRRTVQIPKVALLLPQASISEQVTVAGVWPQLLSHEVVTATPTVLATGSHSRAVTTTASVWLWTVPWTLIAILVMLIVAFYLYRRRRSRRKAKRAGGAIPDSGRVPVTVQPSEVPA